MPIYRVLQDWHYANLGPADLAGFRAAMEQLGDFSKSRRGIPLKRVWNSDWRFVKIRDTEPHPGGIGDFAEMNTLIATTRTGLDLLRPLVGEAGELLKGRLGKEDLWLFNITRRANQQELTQLEDNAVFRVDPIGSDVLCCKGFKSSVEASGLKGLRFREIQESDDVPMI